MDRLLLEKLSALALREEKEILKIYRATSPGELIVREVDIAGGSFRDISVKPHTGAFGFPLHRHNYLEVMIVLAGRIEHKINGKTVTLRAGDILFLSKNARHSVTPASPNDAAINIIISDRFLDRVTPELSGTVFAPLLKENAEERGEGAYLHFSTGIRQIENLVENLLCELTEDVSDMSVITKTVALLLTHLSHKSEALLLESNIPPSRDDKRRLDISAYIKGSYATASLSELAGRLYVTAPYASKLIRGYFGKSFKELLVDERIARAKKLICETDTPIGDIIRSVGYENESYFHREFKLRLGVTPYALRKSVKNESYAQNKNSI